MRKKITMLLASVLVCIGAMAQITVGSVYSIQNKNTGNAISQDANYELATVTADTEDNAQLWLVENGTTEGTYMLRNLASGRCAQYVNANYTHWYADYVATDFYVGELSAASGDTPAYYYISLSAISDATVASYSAMHQSNGYVVRWEQTNASSQWAFVSVNEVDIDAARESWKSMTDARTTAKATVENLATESSIYPSAESTVSAIEAVTCESSDIEDLKSANDAINELVSTYKTNAYKALEGKYFTLYTPARSSYAKMTANGTGNATTASTPDFVWQFVENNGSVNIYNPYIGKYLVMNGTDAMNVTENQAEAGAFDITIASAPSNEGAKVGFKSNGWYIHLNGSLLGWYAGGASEWTVAEVTDFATMIEAYKLSTIATLDSWATLSVVFDADLITTAKTNIEAIETTDFATFAAIDAELKEVTDAVAAKMFAFQTTATDAKRNGVWVSANPSTSKAIGADNQDNNSIWSLRHAGGTSFYVFNELNQVYMGAPSSNCPLTVDPVVAYSFEIVDAKNSIVEMKCNGETMHASNHDDDKLLNYDYNEDASRWYVSTVDVTQDIKDLLATIDAEDYAEIPALGQYPKAAYDALVAAQTTAKTIKEVEAAIATFNASLNCPVYFITSKHDGYAAGSAIYYDGAWKWKTANKFDRQMWMTIPGYTQENVPVVEAYDANGTSYEICDFLTGTVMRGKSVQIVKIANWDGVYNLQYNADATSTDAAQHAKDNGQLVNWTAATTSDAKASAWGVEYMGTSYEISQLTDEQLGTLTNLQTAFNGKKHLLDAAFDGTPGSYVYDAELMEKIVTAGQILEQRLSTIVENAATVFTQCETLTAELDAAELQLCLPEAGKFYRFSYDFGDAGVKYVQAVASGVSGKENAMVMNEEQGAASIFYYADGKLLSYSAGLYVNDKGGARGLQAVGATAGAASFAASTVPGKLYIYAGDSFHANKSGDVYFIDHCGTPHASEHNFIVEEVTTLPVAVSAAGYATLYAPVALTIPADVTVYKATVKDDYLTLTEVEGTIPANTGVLIEAEADTYNFTVTTDVAAIEDNAFTGAFAKSAKNAAAKVYTLQAPAEKEVGFYLFNGTDGTNTTYINGFRAWVELPLDATVQGLRITRGDDAEDTTEIESTVNGQQTTVIYDLAGRRVEKMEKGIYIVNGRKVVIR